MKEGLLGATLRRVTEGASVRRPTPMMLHAGLDLSRKKVDVCVLSAHGEHLDQLTVPPDADSLRTLARRIEQTHAEPVAAAIESMTGARFVHDTLEREGWAVRTSPWSGHRLAWPAPPYLFT